MTKKSASPRNELVLGVDTSAYTTSVAVVTLDGELVFERRIVLDVPTGRRGLRQSDAVFQHVNNLPVLLEAAADETKGRLAAMGASVSPRSHPDSYMPVFRVGESVVRSLAALHGTAFVPVSHQDGHIWAGLWSAEPPVTWTDVDELIVMHASGGTTELFRATRRPLVHAARDSGLSAADGLVRWDVHLLSATEDLYVGQFIDRAGVRLGLPFPAGPHLERLAVEGDYTVAPLPVAVRGSRLSFSGPDTAAKRLWERGIPAAHVAAAVQQCVADSLARWAGNVLASEVTAVKVDDARDVLRARASSLNAPRQQSRPRFLGVGGVMANKRLRVALTEKLSVLGLDCIFAAPGYSVDNAVGVALAAAVYRKSALTGTETRTM